MPERKSQAQQMVIKLISGGRYDRLSLIGRAAMHTFFYAGNICRDLAKLTHWWWRHFRDGRSGGMGFFPASPKLARDHFRDVHGVHIQRRVRLSLRVDPATQTASQSGETACRGLAPPTCWIPVLPWRPITVEYTSP